MLVALYVLSAALELAGIGTVAVEIARSSGEARRILKGGPADRPMTVAEIDELKPAIVSMLIGSRTLRVAGLACLVAGLLLGMAANLVALD